MEKSAFGIVKYILPSGADEVYVAKDQISYFSIINDLFSDGPYLVFAIITRSKDAGSNKKAQSEGKHRHKNGPDVDTGGNPRGRRKHYKTGNFGPSGNYH